MHAKDHGTTAGRPLPKTRGKRASLAALCIAAATLAANPAQGAVEDHPSTRRQMVERGLQYLFSIHKEGVVGDSRPKSVSCLFVLAALSSGILPSDPEYGPNVQTTCDEILADSSPGFFGGLEQPNADHALAGLMLAELVGTSHSADENHKLYEKAAAALKTSLQIQDKGVGSDYFGGWRPNDRTRVNDRILTAWFLLQLRSAELRGMTVPSTAASRAVAFVQASQHLAKAQKPGETGGFSIDARGLPVRSATAAGAAVLALFNPDPQRLRAARDWLGRHAPRWYGPNFYESHFFAVRGLYRSRNLDGPSVFEKYFARLAHMLKERQEPDGSFPFPPGEGTPILVMSKGYSTAMAILILNIDRGFLPMDQ